MMAINSGHPAVSLEAAYVCERRFGIDGMTSDVAQRIQHSRTTEDQAEDADKLCCQGKTR
jgi:hypothetical protein